MRTGWSIAVNHLARLLSRTLTRQDQSGGYLASATVSAGPAQSRLLNTVLSATSTVRSLPGLRLATTGLSMDQPAAEDIVIAKLQQARTQQGPWSCCGVPERIAVLHSLRLKIASNPRFLARFVNRANEAETLAAEVLPLLDACRFLELEAERILREAVAGTRGRPMWLYGTRVVLRREPLGVVLIIGPSNYPLMLPGIQALQALAAGNSVLIKPAKGGTAVLEVLVDMAESVGLPAGVLQVLPESTEAATIAIRKSVDKVFLTGSATTGQVVSRELADSTTPAVMELSGCDAVFLLNDADPELVSDCLLFGLTFNQGQTCMAPRRVLATDEIADQVLSLLLKKLTERQSRNFRPANAGVSRLAAKMIEDAILNGGQLLSGSIDIVNAEPELHGVAILDKVTADMAITSTDLFAPVLSFIRVSSEEQALVENARCPYALSAAIFGTTHRCHDLARRVHAGCIVINDMIVPTADPRVPFGGRGKSGYGVTRGAAGLLEMTQLKSIVSTRRWFKPHLYATTPADTEAMEYLIRIEHARSALRKLATVPAMIKSTLSQIKHRRSQGVREI